jgi:uncharacterized protein (DUF2252 family)
MQNSTTISEIHSEIQQSHTLSPLEHHLSRAEQTALGKKMREACPRVSHKIWKAAMERQNPVRLVEKANEGRMQDLVPLRHTRMSVSPFTFYRGSAGIMAADLATTSQTGYRLQCCGDAHLCNFGGFATPERQVIFSINDLDETLPAPWEWDLKRLAASFVVASRNNQFSESSARDMAVSCVKAYRERMAEFSEMSALELWSFSLNIKALISDIQDPQIRQLALKRLDKEQSTSIAEDIFPKLVDTVGESYFIKEQLPTIFRMPGYGPGEIAEAIREAFAIYRESLRPAYRMLLDRYEIKDAAIKVVGVGSVGTSCWVLLMMDNDNNPLFLQVKEARKSVLEEFAGKSEYPNAGQRVVDGQRLMQPYSDIFLGWTEGRAGKQYYFRQLRDIKISMNVESFRKTKMELYAGWCGYALALSHARSGEAALIWGYTGKSDVLDEAIASFSVLYADQNEKDYNEFMKAIRDGKIKTAPERKK